MMVASAERLAALLRERDPELVVGMPMRDAACTVAGSVASLLAQRGVHGRLVVVVLDDGSTDASIQVLAPFARDRRLLIVRGRWGRAWAVRNTLLAAVEAGARRCRLVFRLDADDRLGAPDVLSRIERHFRSARSFPGGGRRPEPLALLAGNALAQDGRLLSRVNLPHARFATAAGLYERLVGMASGDPLAELPSCNLVLSTGGTWRYPPVLSAEDHFLTARVLTESPARISIADDLIYCTYSLSGALTRENRARARHRSSRQMLLQAWCRWIDRSRGRRAPVG
jgi:glycosyltransferase involved in cell wall biosynthesis